MLTTLKKMKEKRAPWTLLLWLEKKYQNKEFTLELILNPLYNGTYGESYDDYCWLTYTFLPRKTIMVILLECLKSTLTIDTKLIRKVLKSAGTWSRRSSAATAKKLTIYGDDLYDEWLSNKCTDQQDQEYSALMALVMFPGGDPEPPYSPIAEQVLNDLTNALATNEKRQLDEHKKNRAYGIYAKIAKKHWILVQGKVRTPAPKPKEVTVVDTLDIALNYIENL